MLQTIHDKLKGIFAITILVALGVVFVFWGINFSSDIGSFSTREGHRGQRPRGRRSRTCGATTRSSSRACRPPLAMPACPRRCRARCSSACSSRRCAPSSSASARASSAFEATDAEVLEAIRQVPAFQVDGKFSPDAYHAALRSIGMSPERFEAEQREYVLARQLDRGLYNSAFVLPAELERQVALRNETRTLGWVTVPAKDFESAVALDDAAIPAYYEANKSRYMTEEQATVDFVELDIDAFAAKATVTEAALREFYDENKARYTQPGRRHARHILIAAGGDDKRRRGEGEARLRARRRGRGLRGARARAVGRPGLEGLGRRPRRGRARGLRRAVRRRGLEHEAGRDPRAGEDRVRLARHQARERRHPRPSGPSRTCARNSRTSSATRRSKRPSATHRKSSTRRPSRPGRHRARSRPRWNLPVKRVEHYTRAGSAGARRVDEGHRGRVRAGRDRRPRSPHRRDRARQGGRARA